MTGLVDGDRVFLEYPPDYDQLSEDDQMAVALGMAIEVQRQLGIEPKSLGSEVPGRPGNDPDCERR